MLKTLWSRVRQNHLLVVVLCCVVPIVLIVGFLALFKGSSDYWIWLIILLCPLIHLFMIKGHKHEDSVLYYECPECGLEYKEKKWAEKCEEWCSKHKSCNLEITKQAIKKGGEKYG